VHFRVKRGPDDVFLKGFLTWYQLVHKFGVVEFIKQELGWDTFWARGIFVLDDNYTPFPFESDEKIQYTLPQENEKYFQVSLPHIIFNELAELLKERIEEYLWDPETKLYYDWDCCISVRSIYKTATTFWALWAKIPSQHRAEEMVQEAIKYLKVTGGIVSGTEESRGQISLERPNRQWDYPYGWAPHQILAWEGLKNYGFHAEREEMAYRWLYAITKAFVDYNGVVPEKFDVVSLSHLVQVEYGNVGVDFQCVVREGFGWMNASYQLGLPILSKRLNRLLANVTHPDQVFALKK
jgi:alpha,alpha-trehalase